jgi:hypothetical protein
LQGLTLVVFAVDPTRYIIISLCPKVQCHL